MNYGQVSIVDINTNQRPASPPHSPSWFIYERGFTRASQTVRQDIARPSEYHPPVEGSLSPSWFVYEPGFTRASQADRHVSGQAAMSSLSESLPGSSPDAQVTPAPLSPDNHGSGASNASGSRESSSLVGASSSPAYSPASWPGRSTPDISRTRPLSSARYGNPEPSWRFRGYPIAFSSSPEYTPDDESNSRHSAGRDSDDASPEPWERSYLPDPFPNYEDIPQIVRDHCLDASKEYLQRQRDQWLRIFRPTHHDWEDETIPIASSWPAVAFRYVIGGRTITEYSGSVDHAPYLYFPTARDSIATPPPEPPAPTESFVQNIRLIADLMWRRMLHRTYPNGPVDGSLTEIDTLDTVAWRARQTRDGVAEWLAGGYSDPAGRERWERGRVQRPRWERLRSEDLDREEREEWERWTRDRYDREWMLKDLRVQIDAGRDVCYLLGAISSALMLCDLSTEAHERCPWIRDEDFEWYHRN